VLGGLLLGLPPEVQAQALATIPPEAMYHPAHQTIYRHVRSLDEAKQPIDEITLIASLRQSGELDTVGGTGVIHGLSDQVPTWHNILHYAKIVRERWLRRQLLAASDALRESVRDHEQSVEDICVQSTSQLADVATQGQSASCSVGTAVKAALDELENVRRGSKASIGIPTGLMDLDRRLKGLTPRVLHVIAARPGMGKTALACDIVRRSNVSAMYVSLEMDRVALAHRLICASGRFDGEQYQEGCTFGIGELAKHADRVGGMPLRLVDKGVRSISTLQAAVLREKARYDIRLLVLDYLQLLSPTSGRRDNREREVAEISRGLQEIATEIGVTVIALSQLNRQCEQRDNKRPIMSDLRESGAIEQDAHTVMLLYRDDYYHQESSNPGVAEIKIAKNRNGPTGIVEVRWNAQSMTFEDLEA
jgi:replicative DNA helicase